MTAIFGRIRTIQAHPETKVARAHEIGPFVKLAHDAAERGTENETTDRVPVPVCAVRVEFPAIIAFWDVELCEVASAGDLDVCEAGSVVLSDVGDSWTRTVRGDNIVGSSDCSGGDEASTIAIL